MLVPAPWLFSSGHMSFQGSKDVAVLAGFCARFIHRVKLEVRTMEEASWPGKIQDQFGSVLENPPGRIGADSVPST
jgi:hypothetical protein